MEHKPYLIFSLDGLQYGIDAHLVQEIFHLPELTSAAEAPNDIVGLLDLRSKILPVTHLALRLGYQLKECQLSDSIIVLKWEKFQIGIIVNSVFEVKNISSEAIEGKISYRRAREIESGFLAGIAIDAGMIMLLNSEKLFCDSDVAEALLPSVAANTISSFYAVCCPNATSAEKAIFRERAKNLRQLPENSDFTGLMPLAVIGLNGEYFGLDLKVVREFTNIRNITPIPCCPTHVVGNMNLRGEIVTLVDICGALNIPPAEKGTGAKALIIHIGDLVAGIPVDEVFDVTYIRSSNIMPIPAAVHSGSNEYLKGTASCSGKILTILNLPKILTEGSLAVDETV